MSLYVTVNEFKQSPTGLDLSSLDQTDITSQQAQDNALLNVLRRASSWVDNIVKMNTLEATLTTETKEVHTARDGRLTVHVDNVPIVDLKSVGYRNSPDLPYTNIDLGSVQVFDNWFSVYYINTGYFAPSLAVQFPEFGYQNPYFLQRLADMPITIQYQYVNGYFNSSVQVDSVAGDQTLTLRSSLGLKVGSTFTVFDGKYEEDCTVQSVNGNVVTTTAPLLFNHNVGTTASAVPQDVKQATILLASVLIRERGSVALTMGNTSITGINSNFVKLDDVGLAKQILKPYIRVVTN